MKVVSIISQKGGAGKTTTAVNLAAEATNRGIETVIIDLDPQASACSWGDLRDNAPPLVVSAPVTRLSRAIDAARAAGAGLVIIDTGAGLTGATVPAVEAADLVLIPVRVSILDTLTIRATLDVVRPAAAAGAKPVKALLTCNPSRGTHGDDVQRALEAAGAEVAPVRIGDRVLFRTSFEQGRGVVEMRPSDPASHEVTALWEWVKAELSL